MPKEYKRKRLAEEWAQDIKPKKWGNYFNKSERQRGKSEAVSGLEEWEETIDPKIIRDLRFNLEIKLANECRNKARYGPEADLSYILKKLGIGDFYLHKCNCPNPDNYSDEEILAAAGLGKFSNRFD